MLTPPRWKLIVLVGVCLTAPPLTGQSRCGLTRLRTHALYHCVTGAGSPTIVLAAGAGLTSRTWDSLVPILSDFGRVVTFDRAGMGRSDPGPAPRTPTQIARELGKALDIGGIDGPYILVGHSAGGLHMLRFARLYPRSVRAIVLLDTPPPEFEVRRKELLTDTEWDERQALLERGLEDVPATIRLEREGAALEAGVAFDPLPPGVPLVVVVADRQDFGRLGSQWAHRRLWLETSRAWLTLSRTGRLVVAEGSGHMIHHDRPDLVLQILRDLATDRR